MDNSFPSPFLPPTTEDITRIRELIKEGHNPWFSIPKNQIRPDLTVDEIIHLCRLDDEYSPCLEEKQNDLMA